MFVKVKIIYNHKIIGDTYMLYIIISFIAFFCFFIYSMCSVAKKSDDNIERIYNEYIKGKNNENKSDI